MEQREGQLVDRSLRGDSEAYAHIVTEHSAVVCRAIAGRHPPNLDTDDLVAETFVRSMERLDTWDKVRPLSAWLCGIARNLCLEEWRRFEQDARAKKHLTEQALAGAALRELELGEFDSRTSEALRACMRKLDNNDREAVIMRVVEDRPWLEVGSAIQRTPEAARKLVPRVLKSLARCVLQALGGKNAG